MFINFFKTTFRNLWINKAYSFLNIFGLTIGIACAGLILLWVEDELNFDGNNLKKDRIYQVKVNANEDAGVFTHSSTPGPLAPAMQASIPGIAATCRTSEQDAPVMFRIGDRVVNASGTYAEPSIFNIFTLPFVQGNAQSAFTQLHSLVITEKTARKFFGDEKEIIGKTVSMDNKQDYVITGIVKNLPENSTLNFEWLAPFEVFYQLSDHFHKWNNFGLTTYIELKRGVSADVLNKQLLNPLYDFTTQKNETDASSVHIFLFAMKDWRLYDQFDNGRPTGGGRIQYVHLFSLIAWIILFIACINFMNLATARSEKRSREVGVRKVLGAGKNRLILQFLGEAFFMTLLASIGAVILMSLILPAFNLLVQKDLSLGMDNPVHIIVLALLTVICGLVAGSYPSLYLSSFNPVFVLKGIKMKTASAAFIRKGLVVLQFTASIVLIIGTIVIYQQIQHVKSRNLGFNRNSLVQVNVQGNMIKNFQAIRQDLISTGTIENAALTDHPTLYAGNNTGGISWTGKAPDSKVVISQRLVSPEFMSTLDMHIQEGKDFQPADILDPGIVLKGKDSIPIFQVMVTASMERLMGKGSALGKTLDFNSNFGMIHLTIKGVVKDYVYGDMYGQASPVVFYCIPNASAFMYVRLKAQADPQRAITKMEEVLKKLNPGYPFEYIFVDEQFNNMFRTETLVSKLSRVFASIAILISCLGLFGLAAYTAERRVKEIGIRKVLGASVTGITSLLSRDFLQLVFISCLLAFPVAWYTMNKWLEGYSACRIKISWWTFAIAGLLAILIALFTVSFQAIKAAIANPVRSLRNE
jgi:putative ABC transport system permease protein